MAPGVYVETPRSHRHPHRRHRDPRRDRLGERPPGHRPADDHRGRRAARSTHRSCGRSRCPTCSPRRRTRARCCGPTRRARSRSTSPPGRREPRAVGGPARSTPPPPCASRRRSTSPTCRRSRSERRTSVWSSPGRWASSARNERRRRTLMAGHVRKHRGKYQAVVIDGYGRGADRQFGTSVPPQGRRRRRARDDAVRAAHRHVRRPPGRQGVVGRADASGHRPAHRLVVQHDGVGEQRRDARRTVLRHEEHRRRQALRLPGVRILARPCPVDASAPCSDTSGRRSVRRSPTASSAGTTPSRCKPRTETGAPREHPHPFPGSSARRRHTL